MKIDLSKCKIGDKVIFRNKKTGIIICKSDEYEPYHYVSCPSLNFNLSYFDDSGWYLGETRNNTSPWDIIKIKKHSEPKKIKIPHIWIIEWFDNDDNTWVRGTIAFTTRKDAREHNQCVFNKTRIRKYVQAD